jgi:uncharacterized protein YjbI with pentapeptide repeats
LTNISAAGASFEGADLSETSSLQGANLSGAKTNLEGAVFVDSDITASSFVGADISNADFTSARAARTNFAGVRANDTVFVGAHIYGAAEAFDNATDLTGADFSNAVLAAGGTQSGGFDFTKAPLTNAHFDGSQCIACNFTGAVLSHATFVGAYLPGVTLANAELTGAAFGHAWLYCGDTADDWCASQGGGLSWPLTFSPDEDAGSVTFTTTSLTNVSFTKVLTCPDDKAGATAPAGCDGHLLPRAGEAQPIPPPCSASAHGLCPVPTSTLVENHVGGGPIVVVAAAPQTWNTSLSTQGWYASLGDETIRLYDNGTSTLIAGISGVTCDRAVSDCGDGGPAKKATLSFPEAMAVGFDGSLYIADGQNIRRIDPSGTINTVLAGVFASELAVDTHGHLLYVSGDSLVSWAPDGTTRTLLSGLGDVRGLTVTADGGIYLSQWDPDLVLLADPSKGTVTPVVGTGTAGFNGNTDPLSGLLLPGTQVQIDRPTGLTTDLAGDVVFADSQNDLIRAYVPSEGTVTAPLVGVVDSNGNPVGGFNGDGNYADATEIDGPLSVALSTDGEIAFVDNGNFRVRLTGQSPSATVTHGHRPPVLVACVSGSSWSCRRLPAPVMPSAAGAGDVESPGTVTLTHRGVVFAEGKRFSTGGGRVRVLVTELQPLLPGDYTLSIQRADGSVRRLFVTVRP